MKYKIYLDELSDCSHNLISYSKNDINNKINEIKVLGESIKWKGLAHDNFINGFNKRIEKINKLNEKMALFGEYLEGAHINYSNTSSKLNNSWEEYYREIRVER